MNDSKLEPSVNSVRVRLRYFGWVFWLTVLVGFSLPSPAATSVVTSTNTLVWNKEKDQITADVHDWELLDLLEVIAAQTGWHVYVEPDESFKASVKFKELPTAQGLRRLLGDLNFAMLPQTNGPQRLYVFRTAMNNATQQVRSAKARFVPKPKRVPNELIIRVKPGADIEALAKALGAKVVGKIPELNAYRLQFESEEAAEAARKLLLTNPAVTGVEYNYYLEAPLTPQNLGGRSATPTKLTLDPVKRDTSKVVVGLVDTALQKQAPEIEQLIKDRVSLAGDSPASSTSPTHADAMINALAQALQQALGGDATGVQIVHVDVFGQGAGADTFTAALGMYEAYKRGATLINDSFGSYGDSQIMTDVVKFLAGENVPVFAAVGNDASTTPFTPASIPEVIAVTATERGQLAAYANVGTTPDAAAPGAVLFYFNGLVYGSRGTSVSSAVASGVAAGIADRTGAPWAKVIPVVQQTLAVPPVK